MEDESHPIDPQTIEAISAELEAQLARVGVDMQTAVPQLREVFPPVERRVSDTEVELELTIDVTGILETLRELPDGAGTARLVAAYNARTEGFDNPAT